MYNLKRELENALVDAKKTLNNIMTEIETERDSTLKEMLGNILNDEHTEDMTIDEIKNKLNEFRKLYKLIKSDVDKADHKKIAESIIKIFKSDVIREVKKIKKPTTIFRNDYILYEITRTETLFSHALVAIGLYGAHPLIRKMSPNSRVYVEREEFNIFKMLLADRLSSEIMQYFNKDDVELSFYIVNGIAGGKIGKRIMLRISIKS